jgi:pimeloyl-ACP methyl ester carboxylesterase
LRQSLGPEHLAPGPQRGNVYDAYLDMGFFLGPDVFIRQSRAMQKRPDQQATLRKTKIHALVACGEHDTLSPPRRHEFMAHLMPRAVFEVISDAGHFPTLENPERVVHLLEDWLAA